MRPLKLAAALAVLSYCMPIHATEIVAHRGASYDSPENTVASMKLGWEQGADADELDVYLSKDGAVVVMHDATTKRTAGVDQRVQEQTLEELRKLDAGSWKGTQWAGEKIPTLADCIATIPDGKRIFVEIKCGPEVLEAMEAVFKQSGKKAAQLPIIGFDLETVRQAKLRFPDHQVYWLASPKADKKTGAIASVDELVAKAKGAGLDGLDLSFKFPIDPTYVKTVHDAGLKFFVWTVDEADVAKSLAAAGVDGITTNRPAWMREQLGVQPVAR